MPAMIVGRAPDVVAAAERLVADCLASHRLLLMSPVEIARFAREIGVESLTVLSAIDRGIFADRFVQRGSALALAGSFEATYSWSGRAAARYVAAGGER